MLQKKNVRKAPRRVQRGLLDTPADPVHFNALHHLRNIFRPRVILTIFAALFLIVVALSRTVPLPFTSSDSCTDIVVTTVARISNSGLGKVVLNRQGANCNTALSGVHMAAFANLLKCITLASIPRAAEKDDCWSVYLSLVQKLSLAKLASSKYLESLLPNVASRLAVIPLSKQVDYNYLNRYPVDDLATRKSPHWYLGTEDRPFTFHFNDSKTSCHIYTIEGYDFDFETQINNFLQNKCKITRIACEKPALPAFVTFLPWCSHHPSWKLVLPGMSYLKITLTNHNHHILSSLDHATLPMYMTIVIDQATMSAEVFLNIVQMLADLTYFTYIKQQDLDNPELIELYLGKRDAPILFTDVYTKLGMRRDSNTIESIDTILNQIATGNISLPGLPLAEAAELDGIFQADCTSPGGLKVDAAFLELQNCLLKAGRDCYSPFIIELQMVMFDLVIRLRPIGKLTFRAWAQWDVLSQTMYCDYNYVRKIGKSADGSKWFCGPVTSGLDQTEQCVIYSLGSRGEFDFEVNFKNIIADDCQIHTFDCTGSWDPPKTSKGVNVTTVHRWCLGNDEIDKEGKQFYTLSTIMKKLGHKDLSYLKMDIEGWETAVYETMMMPENKKILPRQISFEHHLYGLEIEGALQTWKKLYDFGYRLAIKERNYASECCAEFIIIK